MSQSVYEWDYSRQLLHIRAAEAAGETSGGDTKTLEDELYDERFLVRRPLLRSLVADDGVPPVLLIDEVDRADDEFEAFLLETNMDKLDGEKLVKLSAAAQEVFAAGRPD